MALALNLPKLTVFHALTAKPYRLSTLSNPLFFLSSSSFLQFFSVMMGLDLLVSESDVCTSTRPFSLRMLRSKPSLIAEPDADSRHSDTVSSLLHPDPAKIFSVCLIDSASLSIPIYECIRFIRYHPILSRRTVS